MVIRYFNRTIVVFNVETLPLSPYLCTMIKIPIYKIFFLLILFIFVGGALIEVAAQCPMCRMAAESNLANGGTEGAGLNKGILYMLSVPYLLVATGGFIWYRNNKLVKQQELDTMKSDDQSV